MIALEKIRDLNYLVGFYLILEPLGNANDFLELRHIYRKPKHDIHVLLRGLCKVKPPGALRAFLSYHN